MITVIIGYKQHLIKLKVAHRVALKVNDIPQKKVIEDV